MHREKEQILKDIDKRMSYTKIHPSSGGSCGYLNNRANIFNSGRPRKQEYFHDIRDDLAEAYLLINKLKLELKEVSSELELYKKDNKL